MTGQAGLNRLSVKEDRHAGHQSSRETDSHGDSGGRRVVIIAARVAVAVVVVGRVTVIGARGPAGRTSPTSSARELHSGKSRSEKE